MEVKEIKDDDFTKKIGPTLFGREIRKIVCFRDSFIFGICGGVAGGLICFLSTSKVKFSTHVAFGSLWASVFLYWFPCRYKHESSKLQVEEWKKNKMKKISNKNEEEKSDND